MKLKKQLNLISKKSCHNQAESKLVVALLKTLEITKHGS